MKKITKLMAVVALLSGVFGVALTHNETIKAEAATAQTQRRVYVYLAGGWDSSNMYIHYWGGANGTTWGSNPAMTKVVSDYYQGLFYYDLNIDHTTFMVFANQNEGKESNKSVDISVASLFVGSNPSNTDYKVAKVAAWVADGSKRLVSIENNAPMSSGQAAAVLNNINSCSTSFAGGFNAWPQLNDLFISPSTLIGSTVVTDNFGNDTTITDKTAWLQTKFSADGGTISGMRAFDTPQNNILTITIIGLLSLSAIGGYYILKTKKNI